MERCPTCHRLLKRQPGAADTTAERLVTLVNALGTDGWTYQEAATFFGRSVKRIQNLVREHRLERRYRRVGSHPRRHAFLTLATLYALKGYLPQPKPARPHDPR
jgi:hypothetical protein